MTVLERLKQANPALRLYDVKNQSFQRYGRVLDVNSGEELIRALSRTKMPESGNRYRGSVRSLEKTEAARSFSITVFGEADVQTGYCNGYGHTMNAMEYHKCAEINASPEGLVLLLALPEKLHDGALRSGDVTGFYLPPGVFVEIDPLVLHFAPCAVTKQGFHCLVALEKHTNEPLSSPADTQAKGERKLLWARNKWLTCHPDSPQAKLGAFRGISGENNVLNQIEY